jgi:hypothetical protein
MFLSFMFFFLHQLLADRKTRLISKSSQKIVYPSDVMKE